MSGFWAIPGAIWLALSVMRAVEGNADGAERALCLALICYVLWQVAK